MATHDGQEQGPGPGERLSRAREAMGRSPQDMSDELRLSVDQVRSLEAEAFHRLPGEAYVRGYLRNYAAAVGIPPEEVMAAYDQLPEGSGETGDEDESPLVPAPERPLIEHPWRVVWVSLALLLVVTVVTLWLVGESQEPALLNQSSSSSGTESTAAKVSSEVEEDAAARADESEATPEPTAEEEEGSGGGEGSVASDSPSSPDPEPPSENQQLVESPPPPQDTAPAGGTDAEGEASGEEEAGDQSQTAGETAEAPRPEGDVLTGPGLEGPSLPELPGRNGDEQAVKPEDLETLRVHTWADSWLEVADDRGRTLLRRLVKEGRDVRLYGKAPFQVKVGNAAGVQLYFEGEPLGPLGGRGEVVGLNVDADSPTIPESEVAPHGPPDQGGEAGSSREPAPMDENGAGAS
ncbi:helix-turn-helix domain-containing protein [Thiohalorhabdus sp.]|uniref:helix-turn-helix domain-containing protein n=1 Tax=Thiohalorhabdus sp. TaxID=3094134 RepID=UPI002FC3A350